MIEKQQKTYLKELQIIREVYDKGDAEKVKMAFHIKGEYLPAKKPVRKKERSVCNLHFLCQLNLKLGNDNFMNSCKHYYSNT